MRTDLVLLFALSVVGLCFSSARGDTYPNHPLNQVSALECVMPLADPVPIVSDSQPIAVIVLSSTSTSEEEHAASELKDYIKAISDVDLQILHQNNLQNTQNDTLIAIGTPQSSSIIKDAQLELQLSSLKHDGFVTTALAGSKQTVVYFAANEPRGCIYAGYDFLERQQNVGFWEQAERIPHNDHVLFTHSVQSSPHFQNRIYFPGWGRWEIYWSPADWKKEINWMLKHKFNTIYGGVVEVVPYRIITNLFMKNFNVDCGDLLPQERYQVKKSQEIIQSSRALGMRFILPGFTGFVSQEFHDLYPQVNYLVQQLDASVPPRYYIHPSDPMFARVGISLIRQYQELYDGTDHLYDIDVYSEINPNISKKELEEVKIEFARAVCDYISQADPQGKWLLYGWTWTYRFSRCWSEESARQFLDAIDDNRFLGIDAQANVKPRYEMLGYFHGKQWGYGILHSLLGWTHMHGRMQQLLDSVKSVVNAPNGKNCTTFYMMGEITGDNPLFCELAVDLSWNPRTVALDTYLKDTLDLRYPKQIAQPMHEVLDIIADTVYNLPPDLPEKLRPVYWGLSGEKYFLPRGIYKMRFAYIRPLRQAVEIMLNQAKHISTNEQWFLRDLLDLTRQYLCDLFNYYYWQLQDAVSAQNEEQFDYHAEKLTEILQYQQQLVACWSPYWIKTAWQRIDPAYPDQQYAQRHVRGKFMIHYSEQGKSWSQFAWDYAGGDYFELIRDYYQPRLQLYLAHMKTCLKNKTTRDYKKLLADYYDLGSSTLDQPMSEIGYSQPANIIPTVRSILARFTVPQELEGIE